MSPDGREAESFLRRPGAGVLCVALALLALQVFAGYREPWGLFHDEAYYWANALRPGLGYVDHPPLSAWLLALARLALGDGRAAFVLLPAFAMGLSILITGGIARRLGGGRFAETLAGLCLALAPVALVMGSFYSVNAYELLFWTLGSALVVERIRTGDPRLWLAFGALCGVALLNKHTFLLLPAGLALGVLATPLRADLASRWLWLGAGAALLVASPNLLWNAWHGWPSLAFYLSRSEIDLPTTLAEALEIQLLGANPVAMLVWLPGALALLASSRLRAYRALGIAFALLVIMILFAGARRADRVFGIYPIAFAAGAVLWQHGSGHGARLARATLVILLIASAGLVVPPTVPVLSPAGTVAFLRALDGVPEVETGDLGQPLPLWFTGRLEWERYAREVAALTNALPDGQRERAVILAPHWVFAATLEYHGRDSGLPPVVSPSNAYWFWRGDAAGRDVVIAVGIPPERLEPVFARVRQIGVFRCTRCPSFRPDLSVVLATGPERPLVDLLDDWRHFGINPAPALLPSP